MREVVENKADITKQEARDLIERCLKVLYYRDARSYNRVSASVVDLLGGADIYLDVTGFKGVAQSENFFTKSAKRSDFLNKYCGLLG